MTVDEGALRRAYEDGYRAGFRDGQVTAGAPTPPGAPTGLGAPGLAPPGVAGGPGGPSVGQTGVGGLPGGPGAGLAAGPWGGQGPGWAARSPASPAATWAPRPLTPEEIAEQRRRAADRGLNGLLYTASFLLVAAGAALLAGSLPDTAKLVGVWLLAGVFYAAGLVVHATIARLRPAAAAFVGTGLALVPFGGIALATYTPLRPAVAWLVTSVVALAALAGALWRLRHRAFGYLWLLSVFSLAAASAASLDLSLRWMLLALVVVAAASGLALRRWPASTGLRATPAINSHAPAGAPGAASGPSPAGVFDALTTPATLASWVVSPLAIVVAIGNGEAVDVALVGAAAALQYGLEWVTTRHPGRVVGARLLAHAAALGAVVAWVPAGMARGVGIIATGVVQHLASTAALAVPAPWARPLRDSSGVTLASTAPTEPSAMPGMATAPGTLPPPVTPNEPNEPAGQVPATGTTATTGTAPAAVGAPAGSRSPWAVDVEGMGWWRLAEFGLAVLSVLVMVSAPSAANLPGGPEPLTLLAMVAIALTGGLGAWWLRNPVFALSAGLASLPVPFLASWTVTGGGGWWLAPAIHLAFGALVVAMVLLLPRRTTPWWAPMAAAFGGLHLLLAMGFVPDRPPLLTHVGVPLLVIPAGLLLATGLGRRFAQPLVALGLFLAISRLQTGLAWPDEWRLAISGMVTLLVLAGWALWDTRPGGDQWRAVVAGGVAVVLSAAVAANQVAYDDWSPVVAQAALLVAFVGFAAVWWRLADPTRRLAMGVITGLLGAVAVSAALGVLDDPGRVVTCAVVALVAWAAATEGGPVARIAGVIGAVLVQLIGALALDLPWSVVSAHVAAAVFGAAILRRRTDIDVRLAGALAVPTLVVGVVALDEGGAYALLFLLEQVAVLVVGALWSRPWARWWGLVTTTLGVLYFLRDYLFIELGLLALLLIGLVVWRLMRPRHQPPTPAPAGAAPPPTGPPGGSGQPFWPGAPASAGPAPPWGAAPPFGQRPFAAPPPRYPTQPAPPSTAPPSTTTSPAGSAQPQAAPPPPG